MASDKGARTGPGKRPTVAGTMPILRAVPTGPSGWPVLRRMLLWVVMALAAASCSSLPRDVERLPSEALQSPQLTRLGQWVQARRARAGTRQGSGFRLLDTAQAAYASRLALIEGAQRSLDLQYYAIHSDASTGMLLARIRDAAARGVRVRILLDDFNVAGEDAQVLRLAFEPGIQIRLFNPLTSPRGSILERALGSLYDPRRLQQRMHNKLFIADNAWGITGGRNLGDAYFGGDEQMRFVDLDVLAAGDIVRDMSASFDHYWNDTGAYPVQTLLSQADLDRLRQRQVAPEPAQAPSGLPPAQATLQLRPLDLQQVPLAWAPAALLADQPGKLAPGDEGDDGQETVVEGLLALMRQARREVLVVSPYFVPGRQMMETFAHLQQRGVAVQVLTNSLASTDAPAAHAGYARHRRQLLMLGVRLYEMRAAPDDGPQGGLGSGVLTGAAGGSKGAGSRASLHAKAVIIDRRLAVIGSMNLDLRSQLQNSEVALVVRSAALSQQAAQSIERSLATQAWRVEATGGTLRWHAPPGTPMRDHDREPEAPWGLRLMLRLLGPLAPDELL